MWKTTKIARVVKFEKEKMSVLDIKNKSDHTKAKMFLDDNGGMGMQRFDTPQNTNNLIKLLTSS